MPRAVDMDINLRFGNASEKARARIAAMQAKDKTRVEGGGLAHWDDARATALAAVREVYPSPKKASRFLAWFRGWYDEWETKHGGQIPTRDDVRKALGEALVKGDRVGGGVFGAFFSNKRAWQLEPGDQHEWQPMPADEQDTRYSADYLARTGKGEARKKPERKGLDLLNKLEREEAAEKARRQSQGGNDDGPQLAPLKPLGAASRPPNNVKELVRALRAAHPDWTPEQVSREVRNRVTASPREPSQAPDPDPRTETPAQRAARKKAERKPSPEEALLRFKAAKQDEWDHAFSGDRHSVLMLLGGGSEVREEDFF